MVLADDELTGVDARRFGERREIDISMTEFVDVLSVRRRHGAHINELEGSAFVLCLRRLLRSRRHHARRLVVLVDSAVWLGAAAKGRSSFRLNRMLRRAAALQMADDILLCLIFVPSASNPSDGASRGVRRRNGDYCGFAGAACRERLVGLGYVIYPSSPPPPSLSSKPR